jgi:oxygen-independent coproporphyrinogen-3 oxidase
VLDDGRAVATRGHAKPESWLDAVERDGHGTAEESALSARERAEEMLMMGLRLSEGLNLAALHRRTGISLDALVPPAQRTPLIEAGYVDENATTLSVTRQGRAVLNAVTGALLA